MISTPEHVPPEAATLACRLGAKLGARLITLVGPVQVALSDDLSRSIDVVRNDERSGGVADGTAELVIADASVLNADGWTTLRRCLSASGAAIVVDGSASGDRAGDLRRLTTAARAAGLSVACETLVAPPSAPLAMRDSPLLVVHRGESDRIERLLAAGIHSLALDPYVDSESPRERPARVCIASYEVIGPTRNGGIGTANTSLAQALARNGHDVTLLYVPVGHGPKDAPPDEHWRAKYAEDGIAYEALRWTRGGLTTSPYPHAARSFALYRWLQRAGRDKPFDVVHVPETLGHGYYPLLAKRAGVAFADTIFVVGVHSPTRWLSEADSYPLASLNQLVEEELERRCVELADVVVVPSAYLLQYLRDRGWSLPARCHVQQYVVPNAVRDLPRRSATSGALEELVYFGRLEHRKGVTLFCDALDLLADRAPSAAFQVTFLGRTSLVGEARGDDYVLERSKAWPWPTVAITDLDQPSAIEYVASRRCVAVMPSLVDNLPNTVIEAVSIGLPFLAAASGGIPEIVAPALADQLLFDPYPSSGRPVLPVPQTELDQTPDPERLATRLERLVSGSGVTLQRPAGLEGTGGLAIEPAANERVYAAWHAAAAAALTGRGHEDEQDDTPVAVCLIHRDDETWLRAATDVLAPSEEDPNIELVLVDDASTGEASRVVEELEPSLAGRGWNVRRSSRRSGASARNLAAAASNAPALLYLDGGRLPAPELVATVRRALARSSADVVTVAVGDENGKEEFLPVGGPAIVGLFHEAFAMGVYAIRRSAIERVGGFTPGCPDRVVDRDLLNRVKLTGGAIDVIPEPLAAITDPLEIERLREWAQDRGGSESSTVDGLQVLRPYRAAADDLGDLPTLAYFGTGTTSRALQWRLSDLERQLQAVLTSKSWKITAPLRVALRAAGRLRR